MSLLRMNPVPATNGIPLASIAITDTNTHSYRTDPWNGTSGINIIELGDSYPPYRAYSVFIYNNTNETLTVTVLNNINQTGAYPDMPAQNSTITVAAGDDVLIQYEFARSPVQFLSISLSFSTAPTSASNTALPFGVQAILYTYT